MTLWAVLPVRALADGKQRLAAVLSAAQREALCQALLHDALAALRQCPAIAGIAVISADARVLAAATAAGAVALAEAEGGGGLNAAVTQAADWVAGQGADTLLVMHADLPLVNAAALSALIARHRRQPPPGITLVPDRHGEGTNLLLATPPAAIPFRFGIDSCRQHQAAAAAMTVACQCHADPELALDLDTAADLNRLRGLQRLAAGGQSALALVQHYGGTPDTDRARTE